MWYSVRLVRTDVSEENISSIFSVTRMNELGTLAVTSNWSTLRGTRATRRHIPEDGVLHSHRRDNLKSLTLFMIHLNVSVFMNIVRMRTCEVTTGKFSTGVCRIRTYEIRSSLKEIAVLQLRVLLGPSDQKCMQPAKCTLRVCSGTVPCSGSVK
jgi:hypothetical protein